MEGGHGTSGTIVIKGIYPDSPIWDTIDKVDYYQFCRYVQDNIGLDSRKDGWNAATYCAQKDLWMFAKVLLEKGQMIEDCIPLVKTIKDQDLDRINMLMKYGCYNTGFRDHYKNAVFATGNNDIILLFAKHYKEHNQNLFKEVFEVAFHLTKHIDKNIDMLKTYIDYGFDVTSDDNYLLRIYLNRDYSVNNNNIIRIILENGDGSTLFVGTNYVYLMNHGTCTVPGNHYISVPGPCLNSGDIAPRGVISSVGTLDVILNDPTLLLGNQGRYGYDLNHRDGPKGPSGAVLSEEERRKNEERREKLLQEKRDKANNHPGKILADAVFSNNLEVVKFLLNSNIPLDYLDEYDNDLLHYCIVNTKLEMFNLLLTKMKINEIDLILIKDTDFTSLIFENIGDDLELAKYYARVFLNKTDDYYYSDDEEEDDNEYDEYYEILEKFLTKFPQVIPDILHMVEWPNEIKIILKTGFDIHHDNDFILRHMANNFDHVDAIKYCIEQGANINVVDESGNNIKVMVADSGQEVRDYVNSLFSKTYLAVSPRIKDVNYPGLISINNYLGFDITNVDLVNFDMNFHIRFLTQIGSDKPRIVHM